MHSICRDARLFLRCGALSLVVGSGCGPQIILDDAGGAGTSDASSDTGLRLPTDGTPTLTSAVEDADSGASEPDTGAGETTTPMPEPRPDLGGGGDGPRLPPLGPDCSGDVLEGDVLLPNEVYIAGTLSEGACYRDALSHWSSPNVAVAGFDCYFDGDRAQISDAGRVLYTNTFEGVLREFWCDSCPVDADTLYPSDPLDNDVVLATPACDFQEEVEDFIVGPAGEVLYSCGPNGNGAWFGPQAQFVFQEGEEQLLHLGYDDLALTSTQVVDLSTGGIAPLDPPFAAAILAIRADPAGGFWVATSPEAPELWQVATDGVTTLLGVFPDVPDGYTADFRAALDGCGALYQQGGGPRTFQDVIVRRTLDGASDIVYDEAYDPLVKLHISYLFTGA